MNNKIVLIIASILVLIGLIKPNLSNILPNYRNNPTNIKLSEPSDEKIKEECKDIIGILKGNSSDAIRLRDLYIDIATLIDLDGDDEVIKNTEEIRQANSLSGIMLQLDMKGKYPELSKECKDVIVTAIGEDIVPLSDSLRTKASEAFRNLAWAFNEGSK